MEDQEEAKVAAFTERACSVFRECAAVPTLTKAWVLPAPGAPGGQLGRAESCSLVEVSATWCHRELSRGKKVSSVRSYAVKEEGGTLERLHCTAMPQDTSKIVKESVTGDGRMRALLVKDSPAGAKASDEPQQYIEVWNGLYLKKTIQVSSLKEHGTINEDVYFGSFQLSCDGQRLLYIAEKAKPKKQSFFEKAETPEKTNEDTKPTEKGTEYVYEQSWGELLPKVVHPVVCVLDIESEKCVWVKELEGQSAGQCQWVPGEEGGVVCVGWENEPRKLGFVYCLCRISALYYLTVGSQDCVQLTSKDFNVYSPRFNPQGNKLVYLECLGLGGPHHSCSALKMIDWPTRKLSTVLEIVSRPEAGEFPGLYTICLPQRCWDDEGRRLVFQDTWRSLQEVLCVDVEEGKVERVSHGEGAWLVLDVWKDLVVAQRASPNLSPSLMVGKLYTNKEKPSVRWIMIDSTQCSLVENVHWNIKCFQKDGLPYEAILIMPPKSTEQLPPLAVIPHGGPHIAFPADFMSWPVCLVALGFAVLLVNYRGSTGFGQDNVLSLPGHAGVNDVQDVQNVAETVVAEGVVDKDKIVVLGGSHGGFISVHLVSQYPNFYKAASVRNPVVDIDAMTTVSDIPDWAYVEAGLSYSTSKLPTLADCDQMLKASPILNANKIIAPVQMHLGGEDRRVPFYQGLKLYFSLKALGKTTKVLMYPKDSHPINSVHSDADSFVNSVVWLYRYGCCS